MTKLFSRTFAISPEDVKIDQEISEKIHLLQSFLRPEHLDIPPFLQNEASWLVCVLAYFHTWKCYCIYIDAKLLDLVPLTVFNLVPIAQFDVIN
jgi:hypothetical protein